MKLFIVAIISLCAASAFAQQRSQPSPKVEASVSTGGTHAEHPVPVEYRRATNDGGMSQERVSSSPSVHTTVLPANTQAPAPLHSSALGNGVGVKSQMPRSVMTQAAMPQVAVPQEAVPQEAVPQAGVTVRPANEKAPAPTEHFEGTSSKSEQK